MGQAVTLRPFAEPNITAAYIDWLRDAELMKYSNQRFRTHTAETCKAYLDSFSNTDNLFMAIYLGSQHVGTMTAYVSKVHGTADMGILLGPQSHGKGLATDAWRTLMEHLLRSGTRKVTGGALRCNVAMVRIMVKTGMKPDGVRAAQELVDGKPEDILHYAKFSG